MNELPRPLDLQTQPLHGAQIGAHLRRKKVKGNLFFEHLIVRKPNEIIPG